MRAQLSYCKSHIKHDARVNLIGEERKTWFFFPRFTSTSESDEKLTTTASEALASQQPRWSNVACFSNFNEEKNEPNESTRWRSIKASRKTYDELASMGNRQQWLKCEWDVNDIVEFIFVFSLFKTLSSSAVTWKLQQWYTWTHCLRFFVFRACWEFTHMRW